MYGIAELYIILIGLFPMILISVLRGDHNIFAAIGIAYVGIEDLSVGISQVCNYRYYQKRKSIIVTYNQF